MLKNAPISPVTCVISSHLMHQPRCSFLRKTSLRTLSVGRGHLMTPSAPPNWVEAPPPIYSVSSRSGSPSTSPTNHWHACEAGASHQVANVFVEGTALQGCQEQSTVNEPGLEWLLSPEEIAQQFSDIFISWEASSERHACDEYDNSDESCSQGASTVTLPHLAHL